VYGALKRLREWNEASIDVVSAADINDVSPTFAAWADSLHVSMMSADCTVNRLPLWHGHLMIYGSQVDVT